MTLAAIQETYFTEALPAKPFCADNYQFGTRIRTKVHALKYQHIQLNSPFKYNFISLDIDYPIAPDMCFVWETKNLPEPTYAVINPINNHAHLIFQLDSAVYANNEKQYTYYQDVKCILTDLYNADQNFTETLTKNPLHPQWKTIESGITYTLADLKAYAPKRPSNNVIKFNKYKRRTVNHNNADLGHRCELFERSRIISYNEVKNFTNQDDFFDYMIGVCSDQNPSDLKYSDILSTAKSISRYTWKHRERYSRGYIRNKVTSIEDLRNRQRTAATTTAGTKHAKTLAIIEQAINNIIKQGIAMPALTKQYLSKLTGKSLSTIKRYAVEIDQFIRCACQVLSPVLTPQKNSTPLGSLTQLKSPLGGAAATIDSPALPQTTSPVIAEIQRPVLTRPTKFLSPSKMSPSTTRPQHPKNKFKTLCRPNKSTLINDESGLSSILEIIEQMRQMAKTDSIPP